MRHRKDAIFNLKISDEPVYALGVHFTYNIETSHKKNFFGKVRTFKENSKYLVQKRHAIYGKINIVKTLALSKLVFICSVMETLPKKSII